MEAIANGKKRKRGGGRSRWWRIFLKIVGEREEEGEDREEREEDLDDRNLVGIYFLSISGN